MKKIIKNKLVIILCIISILFNNTLIYAQYTNRISPASQINTSDLAYSVFQPHDASTNIKEISMGYDIEDNGWEGWYKNFIVELGAVRFRFFDGEGQLIRSFICLPSQFRGTSYNFENVYIRGDKDIILHDTYPYSINLTGFKFSDNIPSFINNLIDGNIEIGNIGTNFGNENEEIILNVLKYIDLTKFNPKSFNEWIDENNGANLDKLDKEINFGLLDENGQSISVTNWLKTGKDGKLPSITVEPITFYPTSTEEICESNVECADEYGMNWMSTFNRLLSNLKQAGEKLELERIEYEKEKEGDWLGWIANRAKDAANVVIGAAEKVGQVLDDTILDGKINASITLGTKRIAVHCGISHINCTPTEYNYIYEIGENIVEFGAASLAAFITGITCGAGIALGAAITTGVDHLGDLTPWGAKNKEIENSMDADLGSYTKGLQMYRKAFIKSFIKLSYTDTTTYKIGWQQSKSILPNNLSSSFAIPIPSCPDVLFTNFFQGLNFDDDELFEKSIEEVEVQYMITGPVDFENQTAPIKEFIQQYGFDSLDEEKRVFYYAMGFIDKDGNVNSYADYEKFYKSHSTERRQIIQQISNDKWVCDKAFWHNFASKTYDDEYDSKTYDIAKEEILTELTAGNRVDDIDISDELLIERMQNKGYTYDSETKTFSKLINKLTQTYEEAVAWYLSTRRPVTDPRVLKYMTQEQIANLNSRNYDHDTIDSFMDGYGYIWVGEDEKYHKHDKGRGDCYILTDHNAYSEIVLQSADTSILNQQNLLVGTNALGPTQGNIYRFGCGLVIGEITPATASQILIKFHSNLDQLGGTGEIDEQYNLIGAIDSEIYEWQKNGAKIDKIPKTYPDDVASAYKKADNSNYTYNTYTTIQGKEGKNGGGKRFKVDKTKKLTQDILNYAINKQKETDKNNLKSILDNEGINYSNKINNDEGLTYKIEIDGKSYYIDPSDADTWNQEVEKYNENSKSSKYVDEKGNEYTVVILYVDWLYEEADAISDDFNLYEDELSYVYDYHSIHKDDSTRKLTGTANISDNGLFHPYSMIHSYDAHAVEICNNKGTAAFSVDISHTYGGSDYDNCILDEQQTPEGDGTYTVNITEMGEGVFLNGSEINHTVVGYRDKEKDLRTAYKNSNKNSSDANIAIPKYSIEYEFKPVKDDFLTTIEYYDNNLGTDYKLGNESQAEGNIPACSNGGNHIYYCGGCQECCSGSGEDEECHSCCPDGHDCSWHCKVGNIYTSIVSTSFGVNNIHSNYDNWIFRQYQFVGRDNSIGDIIFPAQHGGLSTTTKGDNSTNTTIDVINDSTYTYNYYNNLENTTMANYNSKQLDDVEFYPFIRMRYKDTLSPDWEDTYILAQNKTGVKNYMIAEVAIQDTSDTPTIGLESQWDNFTDTIKGLSKTGILDANKGDKNVVIHGGSAISLTTKDTTDKINNDMAEANIGLEAYIFAVPDELAETTITDSSKYYTVSEAKEALEKYFIQVQNTLQEYKIEKLVAPGVYKQNTDEIAFQNDATVVQGINESDKFVGKKLDKKGKYYFQDNGYNSNYLEIISGATYDNIDVFTIKSDIEIEDLVSHIKFYTNGAEKFEKLSSDVKPNNNYSKVDISEDVDWQKLNNVTGFVDNYIKALEFDVDGGHTRKNSRPHWYNEGQDGLSVVRLKGNIRVGLNEKIFEINDNALTGNAKNQYDLRNWNESTLKDKIRTVRYQLSPAPSSNTSNNGYIGTIGSGDKALDVYLDNIQYLLRSKFIYIDNATVEDSNR